MVTIAKNRCCALRIYRELEYAEMKFCAEGYYFIHGKCRAYSGLLEKCQDGDCYVNGDFLASCCINNICNCSPGYYQREYRTRRPDAKVHDERCIINNDCKGWVNSTCNNVILRKHIKIRQDSYIMIILTKKKKIQSRKNTALKRNVQRMRTVKNLEMQLADL